ncbi:MAG: carbonic anhydrase [Nitrolancea sp.]
MSVIDELRRRNAEFAESRFTPLPLRATLNTTVVTCVDPRVDPAHILGVDLGEAGIIRNIGGRITPTTLQQFALLRQLPRQQSPGDVVNHLVVLHHTDCGIIRMQQYRDQLAEYFGIPENQLETKAIPDPHVAVKVDVALLAATPDIPRSLVVSGLVYDVETGLIETVVPPTPLKDLAGD